MHPGEQLSQLAPILGLRDYQEGTWTPQFTVSAGGPAVFTINEARYTKVGRLVLAMFSATRNDAAALAGSVTWSLPFPTTGTTQFLSCGTYWGIGRSAGTVLIDNFAADIANGLISAGGGVNTYLSYAEIINGATLNASFMYQARQPF